MGRNEDTSEAPGSGNWEILSPGYLLREESALPDFCLGVILPSLRRIRVSLVCLGSYARFVTREGGHCDRQSHWDQMQREGWFPSGNREDTIHRGEGRMDAEQPQQQKYGAQWDFFFSSLYNPNFPVCLKSVNFNQQHVSLRKSVSIELETFLIILLQQATYWKSWLHEAT